MPSRGSGLTRFQTEGGVAAHESVFEGTYPPMMSARGGPDWCQCGGRCLNEAPQTTRGRTAAANFADDGVTSDPRLTPADTATVAAVAAHTPNVRNSSPPDRA